MSDQDKRPNDGQGGGEGPQTGIVVKARPRTKKPAMYKVLMLNDDYTPMEFVVHVLERFFQKNREEATRIMLHVHQHGVGVCGVFTDEVAETKVAQVIETARRHQHPLQQRHGRDRVLPMQWLEPMREARCRPRWVELGYR
jgi:ATP-dependent Clp protease adaptor protein ClpS